MHFNAASATTSKHLSPFKTLQPEAPYRKGAIAKVRRSPAKRTKWTFKGPWPGVHFLARFPAHPAVSENFVSRKSRKKMYKISWNPSLPLKRTKVRTSGFNSQTCVCKRRFEDSSVAFRPPPPRTNFFISIGLSELLRYPLSLREVAWREDLWKHLYFVTVQDNTLN